MIPLSLDWELKFGYPSRSVVGVDEVGRGCIAGPVVACALVLPSTVDFQRDEWLSEVTDSKKLTAKKREELSPRISAWAAAYALGSASVEEIDRINILQATFLAMRRALDQLNQRFPSLFAGAHVLLDGSQRPRDWREPVTTIVEGDQKVLSIACASILAKVARDREMAGLESDYPGYGFGVHKGYGTRGHLDALGSLGVTPIHRKSFAPVRERLQERGLHTPTP